MYHKGLETGTRASRHDVSHLQIFCICYIIAATAGLQPLGNMSESEARFVTAILDTLDALVVVLDRDGGIVRLNHACERLTGYRSDELLGPHWLDLVLIPEEADGVKHVLAELSAGGFHKRLENHWRTKDGRSKLISWSNTALADENGVVEFVIATGIDITERRVAEEVLSESEERYRTLVEALEDAVHVRDREGRFVMLNAETARRRGKSEQELLGKRAVDILSHDTAAQISRVDNLVFETGQTVEAVEEYPDRSFAQICHVKKVPLRSRDGVIVGVVTVSRDVTERVRAEAALQEANQKLIVWVDDLEARNRESAIVNEMADFLQTCTTFEDAYSVFSHSMQKLFPDTSGAIFVISASRNLADAVSAWGSFPESEGLFAPDECWGLRRGRAHLVEDPASGLLCRHVHSPLEGGYLCIPMVAQGDALGTFHMRLKERGIPDPVRRLAPIVAEHAGLALANLRLRQTLRDQAVHDQLTGLYNRRYMEEMLDREISRATRFGTPLGVVMIDVDHFKRFNDAFGHEAGDTILSALGGFLRAHTRAEDIACRYGGEELLLILPDADVDATRRKAEELLEGIRQLRVESHRQTLGPVTVSMGVASFPTHGSQGSDLVRAADLALYRAKSDGRDRAVSAATAISD